MVLVILPFRYFLLLSAFVLCVSTERSKRYDIHRDSEGHASKGNTYGNWQDQIQKADPKNIEKWKNSPNRYLANYKAPTLWPEGRIPYVIDGSAQQLSDLITKAMKAYTNFTCLQFSVREDEENYITFFRGEGCYSVIGMTTGRQILSLGMGCDQFGTVLQQLGHAIGFYREETRSDRDDYLTMYPKNAESSEHMMIKFRPSNDDQLLGPFDFDSIMLSGDTEFSDDPRKITMASKLGYPCQLKPSYDKTSLSTLDILKIRKLYQCPNNCTNVQ